MIHKLFGLTCPTFMLNNIQYNYINLDDRIKYNDK